MFDTQRMLLWNTIQRNTLLTSLNYIHIYIESFSEILKNSEEVKMYIKTIILKNKINKKDLDNYYKIRFMLDGFDGPFYYDKKMLTEDFENLYENISKKIKRDIESISEKLKYDIDILEIRFIPSVRKNQIQKVDVFIKEKYIPIKVL